jgi:hypothetical protein
LVEVKSYLTRAPFRTLLYRQAHVLTSSCTDSKVVREKRASLFSQRVRDEDKKVFLQLNTGQSLVFKVDIDRAANIPVNITGGPLSYRSVTTYRRQQLTHL